MRSFLKQDYYNKILFTWDFINKMINSSEHPILVKARKKKKRYELIASFKIFTSKDFLVRFSCIKKLSLFYKKVNGFLRSYLASNNIEVMVILTRDTSLMTLLLYLLSVKS